MVALAEVGLIFKRNGGGGATVGFKDHDLVFTLAQYGGGYKQRFLRSTVVPIAAKVEAVDLDKALVEAI